jgi:hypothetical protein
MAMNRPRASRAPRKVPQAARPVEPLPPPLPLALLDHPLDYFLSEHHRHRIYLVGLRQAATAGSVDREVARRLFGFLAVELPLHWADEKIDLLPCLLRLARPEDGLGDVLARLDADHAASALAVGRIMAGLFEAMMSRQAVLRLDPALRATMQAYATSKARHLAIENAVVLAIAGVRLRKPDLAAISSAMKVRRVTHHVDHA